MNNPQVAGGAHCGKWVIVKNTANGKTVRAKVQDGAFPPLASSRNFPLTSLFLSRVPRLRLWFSRPLYRSLRPGRRPSSLTVARSLTTPLTDRSSRYWSPPHHLDLGIERRLALLVVLDVSVYAGEDL